MYVVAGRGMSLRKQPHLWALVLGCSLLWSMARARACPGQADLDVGMKERGIASWYGDDFHGWVTASGEIYDMHALTAAHRTPLRDRRAGEERGERAAGHDPYQRPWSLRQGADSGSIL